MNPQSKQDSYAPKWRHFHPQATVWVKNPFDHDVLFNVADEHNNPFQYRMPCRDKKGNLGCISELPGGAVATLGVKEIVDELIQSDPKDLMSMWEVSVRQKWEDTIILKIKEAPASISTSHAGEVNLQATEEDLADDNDSEQVIAEAPVYPAQFTPQAPVGPPTGFVGSIADASIAGQRDVIINE